MEQLPALYELAAAFHACRDVDSLLRILARKLGDRLGVRAVLVWMRVAEEGEDRLALRASWFEPGTRLIPAGGMVEQGILPQVMQAGRARRLGAKEIDPQKFAHLDEADRERVRSAAYGVLLREDKPGGVVEALNKKAGEFTADEVAWLEEVCRMSSAALDSLSVLEQERSERLSTIERLTQLYDLSRIFNATRELDDLLPIVAGKVRDIMGAAACSIWLVTTAEVEEAEKEAETEEEAEEKEEAECVYCAHLEGDDATVAEGDALDLGEGVAGTVAQRAEPLLIAEAEKHELLRERRKQGRDFALTSLLCVPLLVEGHVIGALEVVNRADEGRFDEDDLFFLNSIGEQAAIALNNAKLLQAERKVRELDALLTISKGITSTLNLDKVLATVVNEASTVLPFDRCTVGIVDREKFELAAVSGEEEVPKTEEMKQLRDLLAWVARQDEAVSADKGEAGWAVDPEDASARVRSYLESSEYEGFYAVPLRDEQGTVGVLALESSEADFLTENHLEVLSILAGQATVAIRNAQLYQKMPLLSVMRPLTERMAKLEALPRGTLVRRLQQIGAVAALLVVIWLPLRISTQAIVLPAQRLQVSAEVEGVIQRVAVREGEAVQAGQLLAEVHPGEYAVKLEQARANEAIARREFQELDARGELGGAAQARLRMEIHQAEAALYAEKLDRTRIRARAAGVVLTPKVEEKVGQRLGVGDVFCELADLGTFSAELPVAETDLNLVLGAMARGKPVPAKLKLNAFPTETFRGEVERVSSQVVEDGGDQYFIVRARFPNPEGVVRTGMVGRGKISVGWYPLGYLILRAPVRWLWRTVWGWLP